MINLIPPKSKKSLLTEYWFRVSSVWLSLWAFALFASAGIMLPVYVLTGEKVEVYATSAEEASLKVAGFEDVSTSLIQASKQARVIMDESELPVFSDYISLFEGLQGADVQLNQIVLGRDEAGLTPASLVGIANNRQSLASFRDRILAEKQVSEVDLPISNLAGDKDIKFSIMVTMLNDET